MNKLAVLSILLVAVLMAAIPYNVLAVISSSVKSTINADWPKIELKIKQVVNNTNTVDEYTISVFSNTSNLKDLSVSQYNSSIWLPIVINGTIVNDTHIPPVEICGNGIDDDGDGLIDEGCPIKPPEQPDTPPVNVNETKFLRIAVLGDIDNNQGLIDQLNLAIKYNVKFLLILGDYGYDDCQKVVDKLHANGFNENNSAIVEGNHDCSAITKAFNKWPTTYGFFGNISDLSPFIAIMSIDANMGFDCNSAQFAKLKSDLESSDAWYNIAAVHQPFVTVKSTHGDNGQYGCYNPLFAANGVKEVLGAHNHNYQRFNINGMLYGVFGTGTHDTGSSMYPLNSNSWNGNTCQKCITGKNGITIMDFQIDDPHIRSMLGWFITNSEQTMDKFHN